MFGRCQIMAECRGWHLFVFSLPVNKPSPTPSFSTIREFQEITLSPHFGHFLAFLLHLWGPRHGYFVLCLYGSFGMGFYCHAVWLSVPWCLEMGIPETHLSSQKFLRSCLLSTDDLWGAPTLEWGGDCHGLVLQETFLNIHLGFIFPTFFSTLPFVKNIHTQTVNAPSDRHFKYCWQWLLFMSCFSHCLAKPFMFSSFNLSS